MKLEAVIVEGFRGCRDRTSISFDSLTAFIGRNDVGKSSILEALDAFFNDEIDSQDLNTGSANKRITIGCVFSELPEKILMDATAETTLADEYLLNGDGRLEIYKRWKVTATKAEVERVFVVANAPTNNAVKDLIFKKRDDLRAMIDEWGVGANRNINPSMRRALYAHVQANDGLGLQNQEVELDIGKEGAELEDARKIWKKISERHLPVYCLFKAEQVSGDKEEAVRTPLSATLKSTLKALDEALKPIAAQIETAVKETTDRTLRRLQQDYPDVARNLVPEYKAPSWAKAFDLDVLRGDDQVPLNKRGAGVRRLVVLAFFQAEAEKKRTERADGTISPRVIYAIEEPETSQHPDYQKRIIKAFRDLAEAGDQVILTTHVPGIAALIATESVRLVTKGDQGQPVIEFGDDQVFEKVVNSLGLTPDGRAKVAIYVEGPNDVEFLTRAAKLYRANDQTVPDLENDNRIVFVVTGGGNLQHWIAKRYLANARLVEVHIYDTDDPAAPKYRPQVDLVNARNGADVGYLTQKREMENYLHADAIAQSLSCNVAVDDWCDIPSLVAEQIHIGGGSPKAWAELSDKDKSDKMSRAKKRLNSEAAAAMSVVQLQARDAAGEVLGWLHAIRDRCG